MKKLLVLATLFIGIITLAACASKTDTTRSTFDTKEDLFGFSAATSIMALNNAQIVTQNTPLSLNTHTANDPYDLLGEIDELEQFLPIVNSLLDSSENTFNVNVESSDLEDYDHLMIISMMDFNGEMISYDFYYNETIIEYEEDDDEEEQESSIEGIIIIDGVTYQLTGVRELEAGEESLEMTASIDELNYVTIDFDKEIDAEESETNFLYELFEDGDKVKSIEMELEIETDEKELKIMFIDGTRESEFSFELETDGDVRELEIEFKVTEDGTVIDEGEINAEITYDESTQAYVITYTVKRGSDEEVYEDNYDDDDDDDDDDDIDNEDDDEEADTV